MGPVSYTNVSGHWEARELTVTLRGPDYVSIYSFMDPLQIKQLIEDGFDEAVVEVKSDDNTHFEALVVAREFAGKRPLARHQLVYATLGRLVGNEIHALSITALTPEEFRARAGDASS